MSCTVLYFDASDDREYYLSFQKAIEARGLDFIFATGGGLGLNVRTTRQDHELRTWLYKDARHVMIRFSGERLFDVWIAPELPHIIERTFIYVSSNDYSNICQNLERRLMKNTEAGLARVRKYASIEQFSLLVAEDLDEMVYERIRP